MSSSNSTSSSFVSLDDFNSALQMLEDKAQKREQMLEDKAQKREQMFLEQIRAMMNPAVSKDVPKQEKKVPSKSKTAKPPIKYVKTEPLPPIPTSDEDNEDNDRSSSNSARSEVQFISQMTKHKFSNDDNAKKVEMDQLNKVREKRLKAIPMLKFTEVSKDSTSTTPTHNYVKWLNNLLKFFATLSPQLAISTKHFLAGLDVDNYLKNSGNVTYPVLDEEDYTNLMKLSAMEAISSTVSDDFIHFVDEVRHPVKSCVAIHYMVFVYRC